jgi:hypothetical protein
MRSSVLNRMVELALHDGLATALDLTDTVALASGQTISVKTDGTAADLAIYADKSCDHCLRVAGKLDGTIAVKVPVLPIQRVPLTGSFSLVAPIEFARNQAGKSEVRLNLQKMAEIGKSTINAEIAQLAPTWANVLKAPVSQKLMAAVVGKLGAVTLLEFNGPNLGIDGFEMYPTSLKTHADKGLIYLGFGSNLAGAGGLEPFMDLGTNENTALSMSPTIMIPALQAGLKASKIARRYTDDGKDAPTGPLHLTVQSFTPGADANALSSLSFRLSNLPNDGQCYWVDAQAQASMAVKDDKLVMTVKSVDLKDSSLPGIALTLANWASASFLGQGREVMERSLSDDVFTVPGSTSILRGVTLRPSANAFVLSGKLAVEPTTP